jgi:hypothetical protein
MDDTWEAYKAKSYIGIRSLRNGRRMCSVFKGADGKGVAALVPAAPVMHSFIEKRAREGDAEAQAILNAIAASEI